MNRLIMRMIAIIIIMIIMIIMENQRFFHKYGLQSIVLGEIWLARVYPVKLWSMLGKPETNFWNSKVNLTKGGLQKIILDNVKCS